MDRGNLFFMLLACHVTMVYPQQCRQVMTTVCHEEVTNSRMQKGDKGDVGRSGIAGSPGAKGEVGEKGMQGDSCALGSLGTDIVTRLARIEELLAHPSATTTTTVATTTASSRITSCVSSSSNGVHILTSGVEVFCDDGWTVFQRRIDGTVSFQRGWDDYANGFGQINWEFWLGLDKIHEMTRGGGCRLKIELEDFDGDRAHADYSSFLVDSTENLYRLRVYGYSGNAGDSFGYSNNAPFSTYDKDNDSDNCASAYAGNQGWWMTKRCCQACLNGLWMRESTGIFHGIIWYHWKGYRTPLRSSKMKFRCD
ncbi:unnamed protein product [Clavelina lepadiformis]|uniref:Fibrinogen C-terminal domain-containing protein n=1 Tax=Clavelina lepadiformis TaxID=159417 RepID=A0ABP0FS86_CLALP